MTMLKIVLNGVAALLGFVAAVLWWKSTRVKVPSQAQIGPHGFAYAQISYDDADVLATARLQTSWNRWAAKAAAVAAASQAVAIVVPTR